MSRVIVAPVAAGAIRDIRTGYVVSDSAVSIGEYSIAVSDPHELLCPRCGVIDTPHIGQGSGTHYAFARCRHCGRWLKWLSQYTPDEQATRRQRQRQAALASRPPSVQQFDYLSTLSYTGTVSSMLSASIAISALRQARWGGAA
jgi:hypothetical protein